MVALGARLARAADADTGLDAAHVVHLIDYVGGDYRAALAASAGGDTRELLEQAEVIEEAGRVAKKLPGRKSPRGYDVVLAVARIGELVRARSAEVEVAGEIKTVRARIVADYGLVEAPRAPPSREEGQKLYEQHCATCHGADGRADTPRAREYTPRPANFHDPNVAEALSPLKIFNTIRFGVPNTQMVPFDFLPDESRWNLAFYAATLDHRAPSEATPEARFFGLSDLATRTDAEIADDLAAAGIPATEITRALDDLRMLAPFDPKSAAPASHDVSLLHARAAIARAEALFRKGQREDAKRAIIAAYLDDIEPIEAPLRAAIRRSTRRISRRA